MSNTFLTIQEFEEIKMYELDNILYNAIEMAFIKKLGEKIAKKILEKNLEKKLKDLSCQSYVDIMSLIRII